MERERQLALQEWIMKWNRLVQNLMPEWPQDCVRQNAETYRLWRTSEKESWVNCKDSHFKTGLC